MKKLLAVVGLMILAGKVMAANPATLVLKVTPGGITKDVTLSQATLQFGTLALGLADTVSSSVTVTNNGNIITTYALRINPVGGTTWTAAAAAGADTYNLRALFKDATAVVANFALDDDMTTTSTSATGAIYSDGTVGSGVNVIAAAKRGLWFKLNMPTATSQVGEQNINVEILAQ
jgi:hypothetical protein